MDISVSQLNRRLAVQLPARLPLGLVFVVGRVENLQLLTGRKLENLRLNGRSSRVQFDLVEKTHRLRCELSARAAGEVDLEEGDLVRAGGHMVFDAQQAEYFLLARDLDLVEKEEPDFAPLEDGPVLPLGRLALTPMLADIKKRSEAAQQAPEDMPYWVQKIAPPQFQPADLAAEQAETAVSPPPHPVESDASLLDKELLSYLSEAMDSDEVVELTPELLAQYQPVRPNEPEPVAQAAEEVAESVALVKNGRSSQQRRTEQFVGGLIVLIVLLTLLALIAAIFLL